MSGRGRSPWAGIRLMLIPSVLPAVGIVQLIVQRSIEAPGGSFRLLFAAGFAVAVIVIQSVGEFGNRRGDPTLLPLAVAAAGVGAVVAVRLDLDRAVPSALAVRQGVALALGLVAFAAVSRLPSLDWLKRYKYTWLMLSLALMGATSVVGQEVNGARLWIALGPLRFQPSELVKLTLVIFLSGYLVDRRDLLATSWRVGRLTLPPVPALAPMALMVAFSLTVLALQNDLGSALLLFGIVLILIWVATSDRTVVLVGVTLFAGIAATSAAVVPRIGIRVQNWIDPWAAPLRGGFQQIQSEFALAIGGVFGVGIGRGRPGLIPDAGTDFVLSALGEEVGLVGVLSVLALLIVLVVRGLRIGLIVDDPFLRLVATGLAGALALQTVIIAGGVTRLIPLTGLPVPFVSYGGSSLLINFVILGLLERISRSPGHPGGREGRVES